MRLKYAARGFSGIFDKPRVDLSRLEKISSFDLSLFDDIENLKALMKNINVSFSEASSLKNAVAELERAEDALDRKFSSRQEILTALEK